MKKVLIITYYWPPVGGVAVQRWVKMAKYFRSFGWEPLIYTALDGEVPVVDHSLESSVPEGITVIRRPILEPYNLYRKLLGFKKEEKINAAFLQEKKKQGLLQDAAIWIRGNFFIPDARKFWVKPSIKFLSEYLLDNPVDAIISTGPPHSMHLIGAGLKKKLNIPWVADFRDPWTKIDYYHELKLSKRADKKHHRLEKEVLTFADKVVVVSWNWANDFNKLNNGNTIVITNGYDDDDFVNGNIPLYDGFLLHHAGMINNKRNPEKLWAALEALVAENEGFKNDLKIMFTGKADYSVLESIKNYHLENYFSQSEHLPHKEAVYSMQRSPVLLLLLNDTQDILGRIPAKLFEYLAAHRPILAIGNSKGDAAKIIRETNSGVFAELDNEDDIREKLLSLYNKYKSGNLIFENKGIDIYSRKENARQFAALLDSLQKEAANT
ncbi:MAG: glycosyltransferase [Chitinophagales bacterium]